MNNRHPNTIIHLRFCHGKVTQKEYGYKEASKCLTALDSLSIYNPNDYYIIERNKEAILISKNSLNKVEIGEVVEKVDMFCKIEDYLDHIHKFHKVVKKIQSERIKKMRKEIRLIEKNHLGYTVAFINSIDSYKSE